MDEINLFIENDGTIKIIYCDEVTVLFEEHDITTRRASHVEPVDGTSKWAADMAPVGGPVLGPFLTRSEALAAEVTWLKAAMTERRVDAQC